MDWRTTLGARRLRFGALTALLGAALAAVASPGAWAGETTLAGTIFTDITHRENKDDATGATDSRSGFGIDLTRFYSTVIYKHDDRWSANFTADVCDKVNVGGTKSARCEVFIKKAYVQGHFSDPVNFRLGAADMAWIPYVEADNKYRYVEPMLADRFSFGTSTDWGLHFYGRTGIFNYQVSVVNGGTYTEASNFRSKGVDFEARLAVEPMAGLKIAVGGYTGRRGQELDTRPANTRYQDAQRLDAMVSYSDPGGHFRVGGELMQANDWNSVIVPTPPNPAGSRSKSDEAEGYSAWVAVPVTPKVEIFGRYDNLDFNKKFGELHDANQGKPGPEAIYYHAGVQLALNSAYVASIAYKHLDVDHGRVAGVGSSNIARGGELDEVGVWMQFKW
jgi:hypothetical protein